MPPPREPKPVSRPSRKPTGALLVTFLVFVGAACSSGNSRPSEAEWLAEWEQRQQLVPDAGTLIAGGRVLCDELDGELRVSLPELLPSPTEALDGPVEEWTSHAVSIVFECSADESTIVQQLATLDVLAAEINGGLRSEGS